jgi:hypothetical protein
MPDSNKVMAKRSGLNRSVIAVSQMIWVSSGGAMPATSITVFKEEKQTFIDHINPGNFHHPLFDTDVLSQ